MSIEQTFEGWIDQAVDYASEAYDRPELVSHSNAIGDEIDPISGYIEGYSPEDFVDLVALDTGLELQTSHFVEDLSSVLNTALMGALL